jgi:hypothetical protein
MDYLLSFEVLLEVSLGVLEEFAGVVDVVVDALGLSVFGGPPDPDLRE